MAPPVLEGDLTDRLIETPVWSDDLVAEAGIPVRDVEFVTVGGGIGSFVTVDYLRIAGVPADRIAVLSNIEHPWQTYEYLTRVSQIPRGERIRSDSSSRPDNIWGFPSYALAEAWRDRTLRPLVHVLGEPVFAAYWTPRAGAVFASLEREAARIAYPEMLVNGVVPAPPVGPQPGLNGGEPGATEYKAAESYRKELRTKAPTVDEGLR